jgi:hypothetical protein
MSSSCSASNCSDLARNNADLYAARCLRLINTFIGDAGSHRCSMTPLLLRLQDTTSEGRAACPCARHSQTRPRAPSSVAAFPVGFVWGGGRYHPRALIGAFASPEICVRVSPRKRVWQRVKRGEIEASCQALTQERPVAQAELPQPDLFNQAS